MVSLSPDPLPLTPLPGTLLAVGDDVHWIFPKDLPDDAYSGKPRPTMVGIESLRALKVAAMSLKLTDSQIEDIFYNNAARLLSL